MKKTAQGPKVIENPLYHDTRVSVMDKERFQGWLSDRENRLRSISDL